MDSRMNYEIANHTIRIIIDIEDNVVNYKNNIYTINTEKLIELGILVKEERGNDNEGK